MNSLLRSLGLTDDGARVEPEPGYKVSDSVQGSEVPIDMSLVRPLMKVVVERAQPLYSKGGVVAAPAKPGDRIQEEQVEVDPAKLRHVVDVLFDRIWDFMDLEKQRRGW